MRTWSPTSENIIHSQITSNAAQCPDTLHRYGSRLCFATESSTGRDSCCRVADRDDILAVGVATWQCSSSAPAPPTRLARPPQRDAVYALPVCRGTAVPSSTCSARQCLNGRECFAKGRWSYDWEILQSPTSKRSSVVYYVFAEIRNQRLFTIRNTELCCYATTSKLLCTTSG